MAMLNYFKISGVYGKRKGRHNPKDDIMILPCYGALTTEEQKRVFQKCDDQRQRYDTFALNLAILQRVIWIQIIAFVRLVFHLREAHFR